MFDLQQLVRKNILELKPYASARDEFSGKEGVFLDANENPFGSLNRYPDPYQQELKKKLSEIKSVAAENIFIGNGSDEIIDLLFRIFCNPGKDKALTFSPSYGMYEVSAAINDVNFIKLSLKPDFQIDFDSLKPHLSDPDLKLIFVCSPNNPTGNNLNNLTNILDNFNGIVVIDEAYADFSSKESFIPKIHQYPNLIVLQTLSKAWGLASLRIGVAYANTDMLALLNKVKPPYNISLINQQVALESLSNQRAFIEQKIMILAQRDWLMEQLSTLPIISKIYPSDSNFLLVETANADFIYQQLLLKKVITRNRSREVANAIRISIGTPEENRQLIAALKEISL
ncbi:MAG: histidinol-phosphate transaminase [Sphingobacteriaceae bacterium]